VNLRESLYLITKSSPLFYRLSLRVRGVDTAALFPSSRTDLHLTGYQRSGNTYATGLIRRLFPTLAVASHLHSIATLKVALEESVPTVVLIRDPGDAIPSSSLKKGGSRFGLSPIRISEIEYVAYYRFVARHLDDLNVILFDRLVADPTRFVRLVEELVQPPEGPRLADEVLAAAGEIRAELQADSRVTAANAWHSPEKESLKQSVREEIRRDIYFHLAKAIYEDIKRRVAA